MAADTPMMEGMAAEGDGAEAAMMEGGDQAQSP